MGYEDYISETEAAAIAGVSTNTLSRFAEAGYLQIENDLDGLRMFSKRELGDVFGIRESRLHEQIEVERTGDKPSALHEFAEDAFADDEEPHEPFAETGQDQQVNSMERAEESRSAGSRMNGLSLTTERPGEQLQSANASMNSTNRSAPRQESRALEMLQDEVKTLKNVVNLQEKLLDIREAELADLKSERDWLRSRIERAEEKADRDQLLLLSETQLLRQMLTDQRRKSSPFRNALEWLGVVEPRAEPTPVSGSAIDISRTESS